MTQSLWHKKPVLTLTKEIIDIVQFGSSVTNGATARDIDIAVFFHPLALEKQLLIAQQIKKDIQKNTSLPIHIHAFDFSSFFAASNFSREGILLYGKSLVFDDYFAQRIGLFPRIAILYSLAQLPKRDKVRFNYLLSGKRGSYGLLRQHGGKLVKPGIIEIAPEHERLFTEELASITSEFETKKFFYSTDTPHRNQKVI